MHLRRSRGLAKLLYYRLCGFKVLPNLLLWLSIPCLVKEYTGSWGRVGPLRLIYVLAIDMPGRHKRAGSVVGRLMYLLSVN